jgi:MGT family glycosyltransferase
MRLGPPPEADEAPGQFWKDFIRDTAPVFRKSTLEQLREFIAPTWQALLDGARYVEPRLREILDEVRPDAIVQDNVCAFPATLTHGAPFVRIVSCNPLELRDPELPPVFSGHPVADRSGWEEFRAEERRTHLELWQEFDAWCQEQGTPPLRELEFIHESPALNLYLYPAEADYERSVLLAPTWHRLDSCVRETGESFTLPEHLRDGPGGLVYLSLGSLGSGDVELMRRLIDVLSRAPHRFIVSKGPQHDQLTLADNMWGAELLPQPAVLAHVDLVITHGGNNTVTEAFHFGKPMIVLPLFWDQHDNAARVHEAGFGVRLDTYRFEEEELLRALERLLGDGALRARMARVGERLRASPGTVKAAALIEQVAREAAPAGAR